MLRASLIWFKRECVRELRCRALEMSSSRTRAYVSARADKVAKTELAGLRASYQTQRVGEIWSAPRWELARAVPSIVWLSAIAISNAIDVRPGVRVPREERYLAIVKRYSADELAVFPRAFGALTSALEDEPGDVLGHTFMALELGSRWAGQFFTPYSVCRMMAADAHPGRHDRGEAPGRGAQGGARGVPDL
jgi:hypothetical protein